VTTLRILLAAGGVDWRDPAQLAEATELLQGTRAGRVPASLAHRIGVRHRLDERQQARLAARILGLDGSPVRARALVRSLG
jgi:hypothetical protein